MNWLTIITTLAPLVQYIPSIVSAWNKSPTSGLKSVAQVVQGTPVASTLADIGAQMFPKLSPELHAAAAALVTAHPDNTAWGQEALNLVQSTGYINFGSPLAVDGVWGKKTMAAVEALQSKLGYPVNGFIADAEYTALGKLLGDASKSN